ncbi:reverse transcriptase domain-containing protein [Tanacetum coccineum]|uniref:Reverse transcriptase domain-containing protein n=1 Tax=Tanacetum coccineum TaxID=301880 RepID=A0ABQ4Z6T7_9ASTR
MITSLLMPVRDLITSYNTALANLIGRRMESYRGLRPISGQYLGRTLMEKEMKKYGVLHRFSTAYHPQTNGQVENTNRAIKRILKRTVGQNRMEWSENLDDALWSFRTAFKTSLGPPRLDWSMVKHVTSL